MSRKIEISHKTIIFTIVFLGSLWFLFFIRDVILQVFLSLLIMTILNPTVTKLERYKIPRVLSAMIVYLAVLTFLGISTAVVTKPLIDQTANFTANLPQYLGELNIPSAVTDQVLNQVSQLFANLPSQILSIVISVFSNIMAVFTVLIFALYFLLMRERLDEHLSVFVKDVTLEKRIERVLDQLEEKMGGWARGQIVLMLCVGFATYIGLVLIGIPYAVPLALMAGILEIIPNIGPTLGTIPSVIVGFTISPVTGLAAVALGILVQQVENAFLVPKVMEKSVGVSPVITLLSLLIGFRVAGIVGAFLSVPIVITLQVLLTEFFMPKED